MIGINKNILLGQVGKDPILRTLENGTACCRFPLATTSVYFTKAKERKEETQWHNIICWGRTATNANDILKKGAIAYLEGMTKTRSWEDTDKIKRYATEVHCNLFIAINTKKKEDGKADHPPGPADADLESAAPTEPPAGAF